MRVAWPDTVRVRKHAWAFPGASTPGCGLGIYHSCLSRGAGLDALRRQANLHLGRHHERLVYGAPVGHFQQFPLVNRRESCRKMKRT